jgi:hypothetical protein
VHLALALEPHFIPMVTFANGEVSLAMTEPLAAGRDEFVYLLCRHPRVRLGAGASSRPVFRSCAGPGRTIGWESHEWAKIDLSALDCEPSPLSPEFVVDAGAPRGTGEADLLGTIYEAHLRQRNPGIGPAVSGGHMILDVRYVGSSGGPALARASGAHHAVPAALWENLFYTPHAGLNVLTCALQATTASDDDEGRLLEIVRRDAPETAIPRDLLIQTAEQVLIAELSPEHNVRNTAGRRFPHTATAEALFALGIRHVHLFFFLPPSVEFQQASGSNGGPFQTKSFELPA